MDTDAEPARILNALAPCQQGHTAAANIKPPESPSTSSNARGRATQVRWISPATWETNTKSFSNILSWRVLPSRLNRAVERAMGFPAHPCGICPYYAARCIIRTNTARGSIKLFAREMKTILYYLLVTLMPTVLHASSDDGLFIPDRGVPLKNEVKNGKIVTTWKTERLKPIRVTFRVDTKNKQQYWLELDFPKLVDPGDTYFFLIAGKQYAGFVARNEEKDKVTWALDFKNPAEGRALLKKIAKIFELPSMMAVDQTIGEQVVPSDGHKPSSRVPSDGPAAPADAH